MTLRNLGIALALASVACTLDLSKQLPCKNIGQAAECPGGQTCGTDGLCHELVADCPRTPAGVPQKQCGGNCVDVTKDPSNCGDCNVVCKAGEQCLADQSGVPHCTTYCAPGQTACPVPGASAFICKDLSNDRTNCGACGATCPAGQVCTPPAGGGAGHCAIECLTGLTNCSGNCIDVSRDSANCGACGTKCGAGEQCFSGICKTTCPASLTECPAGSGKCVDTTSDRANCGACAGSGGQVCNPGFVCNNGSCTLSCQSGLKACNGSCTNTATDPANCGGCQGEALSGGGTRQPCGSGQVCSNGACVTQCPGNQISCNGKCVDVLTDLANCGACSTASVSKACGSGETCSNGICVLSCPAALKECGGACVDTRNDPANCGGCPGDALADGGVAAPCATGQVCGGGACGTRCPSGQVVCGSGCADTTTDARNCGSCGHACANGEVCTSGGCQLQCPVGSIACGNNCVDAQHDNQHCGNCATSCVATPGTFCSAGNCVPDCGPNLTLCGASCRDAQNDDANCGGCGLACTGGKSCVNGSCQLVCPGNQQNCSGVCKDTSSDSANCGACNAPCPSGQVCSGGSCTASCGSGLTACGGTCADFQSDPKNCGSCGNACPAATASTSYYCSAGHCAAACLGTSADCDQSVANGCEVDLSSDVAHCGGCLNKCAASDNATPNCQGGACAAVCAAGSEDCDLDGSNGCEANTGGGDASNCGGCGLTCPSAAGAAHFCEVGSCTAGTNKVPAGVQQNLPIASVLDSGFHQCWPPAGVESYTTTGSSLAAIQAACNGGTVMVACRGPGSTILSVAAAAASTAIFSATSGNTTVNANGVEWYFGASSSWGFAPGGASVNRAPCDGAASVQDGWAGAGGSQRLCWPTQSGSLVAGARCGDRIGLGATANYERLVFTK